jgi:hypothetical protein
MRVTVSGTEAFGSAPHATASRAPGQPPATPHAATPRMGLSASLVCTLSILLFVATTAALLLSGRSNLLTVLFPAMATALGGLLLLHDPGRFLALALWLWMLSPFIRRVVDAQHGWNAQNPILLAPMLVCALCALDAARLAPRLRRVVAMPFLFALASLLGGMVVGLFVSPAPLVVYAGLTWVAPVLLGLYVAIHPEHHDAFHRAVLRSLNVGLVLLGAYGVAQFVSPALWDRLWMIHSRMDSIGTPFPLMVRVFSTMNAPGPLAQFLSASLLIVLAQRSARKWPGVALGIGILLLSLARSAWLGFAMGFLLLVVLAPARFRRGALGLVGLAVVGVLAVRSAPLPHALDSMRNTIETRVTTMRDLAMDDSYRARRQLIPAVLADIVARPLGSGLGATLVGGARGTASSRLADQGLYLDNGVLEILLVLGWFGGGLFLLSAGGSLLMSLRTALTYRAGVGYLAGALALLAQVVGGTVFAGVGGAMFWLAVGMALTVGAAQAGEVHGHAGARA